MISKKQQKKYESIIKKYKYTDFNRCLSTILEYLNKDYNDAFSFLKEIMFFKICSLEKGKFKLVKKYWWYLYALSSKLPKSFRDYIKNLQCIFSLRRLFIRNVKLLKRQREALLYMSSKEKFISIVLRKIADNQQERMENYIETGKDNLENHYIVDNLKYLFNDIKLLTAKKTRRKITYESIFKTLLLIDKLESIENEIVALGVKCEYFFWNFKLERNEENSLYYISTMRKNNQFDYDVFLQKKIPSKWNTSLYSTKYILNRNRLAMEESINYYVSKFLKYKSKYDDYYYYFIEKELNKLGIPLNDIKKIAIFEMLNINHFLIVFEFFSFYSSYFKDTRLIKCIEKQLDTVQKFIYFLKLLTNLELELCEKFFEIVAVGVENLKDIHITPILTFKDKVFLNIKLASYNNVLRNLICNFFQYNNTIFNTKYREDAMLTTLTKLFSKTIFPSKIYCNVPFSYYLINDKIQGDIDLVIQKENDIFILECKSILEVVDWWEYRRVSDAIRSAKKQIAKIKTYINEKKQLLDIDLKNKNIIYAIVTTSKVLSGNYYKDVPVIALEDLKNLLEKRIFVLNGYLLKIESSNLIDELKKLINDDFYINAIYNNMFLNTKKTRLGRIMIEECDPDSNPIILLETIKKMNYKIEYFNEEVKKQFDFLNDNIQMIHLIFSRMKKIKYNY